MSEAASQADFRWLDSAVRYARPFQGTTGDRPLSAALIVNEVDNLVIGRAVSSAVNSAEAGALEEAGGRAFGRCLYATVEPQPELVVAAGITRVVVGALHPDRSLRGTGVEALLQAGIEVVVADHAPSADLFEAYASRLARGRPFVTLRLAVSRDGMIAARDGGRITLMGDKATRWAALQRALSDGVMIGAQTAMLDDPKLDGGIEGLESRTFARVLLVGTRPLPERLNITSWISGHPTYLFAAADGPEFDLPPSVEVLRVPGRRGLPDLRKVLALLAERNISSLLVEGGARLTESMLASELVDRFQLVDCAVEIGRGGLPATPLGGIEGRLRAIGLAERGREQLGPDLLRTFEPQF